MRYRTKLICCISILSLFPAWTGANDPGLSPAPAQRPAAPVPRLDEMQANIEVDCYHAIQQFQLSWLPSLRAAKRYDDIAAFARKAILTQPNYTWAMAPLLRARIDALLKLGRAADALQDAKRLYNVAPMEEMEHVMPLVADSLKAAHPDDPAIVQKFIREQVDGADHAGEKSTILDSIKLDPSPYLDGYKLSPKVDTYLSGKGNLLLLAGRAKEALTAFREASISIRTDQGEILNVNDMARAMKAMDGTIANANAFLHANAEGHPTRRR